MGFLATLSCHICDAPSGNNQLVFDQTRYNYGPHYSTRTGKFTAPVTGLYLITSQLYAMKKRADYYLVVDDIQVTFTYEKDEQDSDGRVMGQITIVLKLNAGQQVWIDPGFSGSDAMVGSIGEMYSWFGAHLLKTVS